MYTFLLIVVGSTLSIVSPVDRLSKTTFKQTYNELKIF